MLMGPGLPLRLTPRLLQPPPTTLLLLPLPVRKLLLPSYPPMRFPPSTPRATCLWQ